MGEEPKLIRATNLSLRRNPPSSCHAERSEASQPLRLGKNFAARAAFDSRR